MDNSYFTGMVFVYTPYLEAIAYEEAVMSQVEYSYAVSYFEPTL